MLEIKNLCKTYKTKGGHEVKALDNVSVKFPETGMVFLLGKSGSGKSTLLNVSGGLDKPDSGEIIIKGKNSKDFSASDFDSYRNTFIGFIFQEYNILNEFNIEQNIELALQLQGKKNDKKAVNDILTQVDLKDMAKRKPNTLSGGQKQRVAIARALIKNPEIIMADEPTGALDSNTGKQVFDTLKKLSQTKLVIVVSHDRDFAEIYGDRIIELSDGKIISDVSKSHVEPKQVNENINLINDNVLSIKNAKSLKKEDLDKIYEILKNQDGEVIITSNEKNLKSVKQAIHIGDDNKSEVFNNTTEIKVKEYDGKKTKFIKSHLPFARAFKIGASSIKSKPVRLVFTILLTTVSLVMFAIASTLMLYDKSYSYAESLRNSTQDYEQIEKYYKYKEISHNLDFRTLSDEVNNEYESTKPTYFSDEDIRGLNSVSGNNFAGVITFGSYNEVLRFNDLSTNGYFFNTTSLTGLVDAGEEYMTKSGFSLKAGTYPKKYDEIAISEYMYGALEADTKLNIKGMNNVIYSDTNKKTFNVRLNSNGDSLTANFKIVGIYNVGSIPSEYDELKKEKPELNANDLRNLTQKFDNYISRSYHLLGFVSSNFYDYYKSKLRIMDESASYVQSIYANGMMVGDYKYDGEISRDQGFSYFSPILLSHFQNQVTFYDMNDNKINYVAPKGAQVYISENAYANYKRSLEQKERNKIYEVVNNRYFSKFVGEKIRTDKIATKYFEAIDKYVQDLPITVEGITIEDLEALLTHYDEVIKNNYIFYAAQQLSFKLSNEQKTDQAKYEAFLNAFSEVQQVYNEDYDYAGFDEAMNVINTSLLTFTKEYEETELLRFSNDPYYGGKYIEMDSDDFDLLSRLNKAYYDVYPNSLTDEEYAQIKAIADKYNVRIKTYNPEAKKDENELKYYYKSVNGNSGELEILGYFKAGFYSELIMDDDFVRANATINTDYVYYSEVKTSYVKPEVEKYSKAISLTTYTQDQINSMLKETDTYQFRMTNDTYQKLSQVVDLIDVLKTVFLIVGIVSGVFAALMLFNFISTSINSKIREIGILRAVGARGSDLFKIFFSESGLISAICVVLSIAAAIVLSFVLNNILAENIELRILDFGVINIALIVGGAIIIALIGTFIPVFRASKRQPVESIRTL